MIIGITGPKGSGKDFLAKALSDRLAQHKFVVDSFAAPLRAFVLDVFNMDERHSNGYLKEVPVVVQIPSSTHVKAACEHYFKSALPHRYIMEFIGYHTGLTGCMCISYRRIMQGIGTEIVRNKINPDFWLQIITNKDRNTIISDVRLPNEVNYVRDCGVLIHVHNPLVQYTCEHSTEQPVLLNKADLVFFNDTRISMHKWRGGFNSFFDRLQEAMKCCTK